MNHYRIALNFEDGVTRFVDCGANEKVLDAAFRNRINLPMDCSDGVCGTCKCKAESGTYDLGDDFIDDAGQLEAGLGAVDLRHEDLAVEVIELFVEDPDQPDVLVTDMLQLGEPPDQFAGMQAIGATRVRLAGFFGEGLWLTLGAWLAAQCVRSPPATGPTARRCTRRGSGRRGCGAMCSDAWL